MIWLFIPKMKSTFIAAEHIHNQCSLRMLLNQFGIRQFFIVCRTPTNVVEINVIFVGALNRRLSIFENSSKALHKLFAQNFNPRCPPSRSSHSWYSDCLQSAGCFWVSLLMALVATSGQEVFVDQESPAVSSGETKPFGRYIWRLFLV